MSLWRQVVTTNTAQRWADDRGMPLFETSAKDDSLADHVDGIFLTLAHKLKEGKTRIEQVLICCLFSFALLPDSNPTLQVPDPSSPGTKNVRLVYRSSLAAPPAMEEPQGACCF